MATYMCASGASPTTAAFVKIPTNAALKTMLQISASAGNPISVIEWGISYDGSAAATPIATELITSTAGATGLTAHVAAGVVPYIRSADVGASSVTLGTGNTGYNLTTCTEGTPAGVRMGDLQLIAPTNQYIKQFPLGREFFVPGSTFLRIRCTAAVTVNAYCYVIFTEL